MMGLASSGACETLVDEGGDDDVVGGLAGSGACDTLVVEVFINEWGGCVSGMKGRRQ